MPLKSIVCCLILILGLTSCGTRARAEDAYAVDTASTIPVQKGILGIWSGRLEVIHGEEGEASDVTEAYATSDSATVVVEAAYAADDDDYYSEALTFGFEKIEANTISGFVIWGSSKKPFKGILSNNALTLNVTHEGDSYTFSLEYNPDYEELKGIVQVNGVQEKEVQDLRKNYERYNSNNGDYTNASLKILGNDDLEDLTKSDLEDMKTNIYARHGYIFKDANERSRIENEYWYVPLKEDVTSDLTELERMNLTIIDHYYQDAPNY